MGTKNTGEQKSSRRVLLTGFTLASAIALTYPNAPAKVYAAGNLYEWVKHVDHDLLSGQYSSAAISADGSHMLAGVANGGEGHSAASPLFISTDHGATWENIDDTVDGGIRNSWSSVDVSNNGQKMVAASNYTVDLDGFYEGNGKIFVSNNAGEAWEDITPANVSEWQKVAISGDGSRIVAGSSDDGDGLFISDNGGDTWQNAALDESMWEWDSISISDDGDTILIGGENGESGEREAYVTTNGGDTWQNITPDNEDDEYWILGMQTAMSANGGKIAVATYGSSEGEHDDVLVSTNHGDTWTNATPSDASDNEWSTIAFSDNGSKLAVADSDGNMYISSNNGSTWDEENPGEEYEDTDNEWRAFDFNADGSRVITASTSNAYSTTPGNDDTEGEPDTSTTKSFVNAESGKAVKLTTPDGTTITCHSPVKESGLKAQDSAYAYPLGLVDFCFSGADADNQVSLVFVTDLKPNQVAVRKYNPDNASYATVTGATVSQTTYNGEPALLVSYNIVDNGPLDTDKDLGEIADPVGLGVLGVGAPNTGLELQKTSASAVSIVSTITFATGLLVIATRRNNHKFPSQD